MYKQECSQPKIWLSPPHLGGRELEYIQEAFDSNWIAPVGKNIDEFEKTLGEYLSTSDNLYAVALNSGTAALHLALIMLGIKKGDEVICQSMTFAASANPILYLGGIPIFVDSERRTWNICPELLEHAILDRIKKGKKPKAIIAVHLYGMPYQHEEIKALSRKYQIPIIEDAAEALGSEYKKRKCGSLGDFSVLSFNGNKIITTSGGGALIVKNMELKERAIFLATQARDNSPHYQHSYIGYNYRLSNVLAGIGRGQMQVLNNRVAARRFNYDSYVQKFSKLSNISFLPEMTETYPNRWLSCILTSRVEEREKIRLHLQKQNIESRLLWKPLHTQPIFKTFPSYLNGVSEELFEKGLCLPSGSNLKNEEINRIVKICLELF
jgi:dTDP-4-amino-4,6-dideoxygalactose transaminase